MTAVSPILSALDAISNYESDNVRWLRRVGPMLRAQRLSAAATSLPQAAASQTNGEVAAVRLTGEAK